MIVSDDTFLVNAALIRVLFGLDIVEVIFELVRGDFLIGFGLDTRLDIFDVFYKVAKCFESGSALFWPEKRQNAPQIFFSKNATICVKGATIWEFFG